MGAESSPQWHKLITPPLAHLDDNYSNPPTSNHSEDPSSPHRCSKPRHGGLPRVCHALHRDFDLVAVVGLGVGMGQANTVDRTLPENSPPWMKWPRIASCFHLLLHHSVKMRENFARPIRHPKPSRKPSGRSWTVDSVDRSVIFISTVLLSNDRILRNHTPKKTTTI